MFRALAEVTVVVHFLFLVYLVAGGVLALRWPRAVWVHLAAVAWSIGIVTVGQPCPLTILERWARRRGGAAVSSTGFIDTYVRGVIFPSAYLPWIRVVVAAVVVGTYLCLWRQRRIATGRSDDHIGRPARHELAR